MPAAGDFGGLLDALVGVSWPARRPIGSGVAGSHPSRLRGMTAEFTEYRPYRQGDDPRRLDWKLLARTDRAYLRVTDDHATRTTLLLVDASASMAFPSDSLAKWGQACRVAVGLAAVARRDGDPVGLFIAREQGDARLPPSSRRLAIADIIRTLGESAPRGSSPLASGLHGIRAGWRVAIVSDFLGDEPALLRAARELIVNGVEVFAIHIVAAEEETPSAGVRLATDPEDNRVRRVLHEDVVSEYVLAFSTWRASLADAWRRAGAEYSLAPAEEDAAAVIRRIARGLQLPSLTR
ncbi:MAG: DUF58 domain-containing protein [Gemmatimonadota bacterium]